MGNLEDIIKRATERIDGGYYNPIHVQEFGIRPLSKVITPGSLSVITEIKYSCYASQNLMKGRSVESIAREMESAGAKAICVAADPYIFGGKLDDVKKAKQATQLPIIFRDCIIDPVQIRCAKRYGADAVVVNDRLLETSGTDNTLEEMVAYINKREMEALVEVSSTNGFKRAKETDADAIIIENRDRNTMEIDLRITTEILNIQSKDRIIISHGGIRNREDARTAYVAGVDAVIVGTSVLLSDSIAEKIAEFKSARHV